MLFNVPQYIDVEDKIAGPFTGKQLLWIFAAGGVLLILYGFLDLTSFIIAAIPVVIIFGALAFYRPYNQPLINFLTNAIYFLFHPKIYIWRREVRKRSLPKKEPEEVVAVSSDTNQTIPLKTVEDLSQVLDSEGSQKQEELKKIIVQMRQRREQAQANK